MGPEDVAVWEWRLGLHALETGRDQSIASPRPDMPGFTQTRKEP